MLSALLSVVSQQGTSQSFSDFGTLAAHYDGSDDGSFTYSSGTEVATWADLSGNGYTMTTHAGSPARSATQNGLKVVTFASGDTDCMNAGDVNDLGTDSKTFLVVLNRTSTANQGIYGKTMAGTTDGRWGVYYSSDNIGIYDEGSGITQTISSAVSTWHVLTVVIDRTAGSNNASVSIAVDDGSPVSTSFTDPGTSWNTAGFLWLGAYGNSSGTNTFSSWFFSGDIAEIVDYEGLLSAPNLAAAKSLAMSKWGI